MQLFLHDVSTSNLKSIQGNKRLILSFPYKSENFDLNNF